MRIGFGMTAGLLALMLAMDATAATDSAVMQVSVTVVPNCRIAVTDLAFGAYDPLVQHSTTNLDGTARVRVVCTKNERASILMQENGAPDRTLRSGEHQLAYGIYTDSARTRVWGSGANAVQLSFEQGSTPQELTVFGRIPGGQVVPAGSYVDAVTATVDF